MTTRTIRVRVVAGVAVFGLIAAACSSSSSSTSKSSTTRTTTAAAKPAAVVYPGTQWDHVDAASAGFDQAGLDEIATRAKKGGSNCFLVSRRGKIVDEQYWNNTTPDSAQEVFSATKSYTSTLVGIAQHDGKLDIADKASKYIPQWAGGPSADVTLKNLLQMDSGRHWDVKTDYLDMAVTAKDKTAFSIALGQDAPPGTKWVYNNAALQTMATVLQQATGEDPATFAQDKLLGPIGMAQSRMIKDASGGTLMFMGLQSTCRDMARYGYLMLNNGKWKNTQVVPAAWVHDATGHSSQPGNAGYGYLWWLNRKGPIVDPLLAAVGKPGSEVTIGQMAPGAPADMYWAIGLGGQFIQVDPGSATVVVRLGPARAPDGAREFSQRDTADVVTQALTK